MIKTKHFVNVHLLLYGAVIIIIIIIIIIVVSEGRMSTLRAQVHNINLPWGCKYFKYSDATHIFVCQRVAKPIASFQSKLPTKDPCSLEV